ncbi:MAG TPA: histidine kinase [Gemmatimonadaceae bacterium]|nr:histidine kinase [Gemmatimonadaceae bacterium]
MTPSTATSLSPLSPRPADPPRGHASAWPTGRRVLVGSCALLAALAVNTLALADAGFTPWWHALGAATGNVVELALVAAVAWGMSSRPALRVPGASTARLLARHAAAAVTVALVAVALNRAGRLLPHTHAEHHPAAAGPDALWLACWFLFLYGAVAAGTHAAHAVARLRERELEATRAELRALRAQLDPHFLFNALHSVGVLVRRDPARAEDAVEQLGDLLRYVLRASRVEDGAASADVEVPLREELAFVRDYLDVERLRFDTRLRVLEEIEPETAHALVPALLLQPLVENAVKYAVGARRDGATVRLVARRERDAALGDVLRLGVVDDGPGARGALAAIEPAGGMPATPAASLATTGQWTVGEGVGLEGLRCRLAACYPERHRMDVVAPAEGGFAVWLRVPWRSAARRAATMDDTADGATHAPSQPAALPAMAAVPSRSSRGARA